jgi:ribonucleoside-diphosphate reductase alpha chain
MDDTTKSLLAELVAKVEELQTEKAELADTAARCADTVRKLTARVENQNAQISELTVKVGGSYRKRPSVMNGRTVQQNVGCGPLYVTLNEDEDGKPFEVFFKLGKSGSCQQSYLEALGVAMSVGLRYGADPQKYVDKLSGMRCPIPLTRMQNGGVAGAHSCADAISQGIAKALALALPGTDPEARSEAPIMTIAEPRPERSLVDRHESAANGLSLSLLDPKVFAGVAHPNGNGAIRKAMSTGVGMCPKCSGPLISQGGCIQCLQQCGYVKCS